MENLLQNKATTKLERAKGKKSPVAYYYTWASVAEISTYSFSHRSCGDNDLALGTAESTLKMCNNQTTQNRPKSPVLACFRTKFALLTFCLRRFNALAQFDAGKTLRRTLSIS
jgi:hypothetical protein